MNNNLGTPQFGNLSGVRVVFSAVEVAGPTPAHLMADWGAEVIWIEHSKYGDTIRDQKNYQEVSRRNMYSLSVDIFSEEGKNVFLKLMETTDILIESSKGPAFARRGLTDEVLWQANKKLVIAHLSGYGHTGDSKYVNLPAYDNIAQALGGYLIQNGQGEQLSSAYPYAGDYFSGLFVLGSSLAALLKARETGVGESIDIAMYEVLFRMGSYYMVDYFNDGKLYPRASKGKDPAYVGCGLYKCNDGHYVALALVGNKQVKGLLEKINMSHVLGNEYPEDSILLSTDQPISAKLEDMLDEYFASMNIDEAENVMSELVIAASRVMTIPEIMDHSHYKARQDIVEWKTQSGRNIKGPNVFPKFAKNPGQIWRPTPSRGLDTAKILGALGYSDAQIKELNEKGIIKTDSK